MRFLKNLFQGWKIGALQQPVCRRTAGIRRETAIKDSLFPAQGTAAPLAPPGPGPRSSHSRTRVTTETNRPTECPL
ncbi:unnamed protein product [Merluccius merluccius]